MKEPNWQDPAWAAALGSTMFNDGISGPQMKLGWSQVVDVFWVPGWSVPFLPKAQPPFWWLSHVDVGQHSEKTSKAGVLLLQSQWWGECPPSAECRRLRSFDGKSTNQSVSAQDVQEPQPTSVPGPALSGYIAWAKIPVLEWAPCQPACRAQRKGLVTLHSAGVHIQMAGQSTSQEESGSCRSLAQPGGGPQEQDWDAARMDPGLGSALTAQLQHHLWISPEFQSMSVVTFCLLINELPISLNIFKSRYPEAGSHGVSSWNWRGVHVGRLWRNHKSLACGGLNWTSSCSTQRGECWASEDTWTGPSASVLEINTSKHRQKNQRGTRNRQRWMWQMKCKQVC